LGNITPGGKVPSCNLDAIRCSVNRIIGSENQMYVPDSLQPIGTNGISQDLTPLLLASSAFNFYRPIYLGLTSQYDT
jgi:hypothetical protein